MAKLFNMYIYNRSGNCLFYKEWNRPLNTLADDPEEEKKLMFGMLFSLKDLAAKLSPSPSSEGIHTVKTDTFTLHHFQSFTGLVFIINSDPDAADMYSNIQHIYSNIFVEFVCRNPLYKYNPNEPVDCPLFASKLEDYLFTESRFTR